MQEGQRDDPSHAEPEGGRGGVLDPISRATEIVCGIIMAVSFTGSISVVQGASAEVGTMIIAAFGCNLAWGLADAIMYLVGLETDARRRKALLLQVQTTKDLPLAHRIIADALPPVLAAQAGTETLEACRLALMRAPIPRSTLGLRDYEASVAIFLLVVLATCPVVLPFLLLDSVTIALRLSYGLALVTLFICGWTLGRHAGGSPWRFGFTLAAGGAVLAVVIVLLGG